MSLGVSVGAGSLGNRVIHWVDPSDFRSLRPRRPFLLNWVILTL